MTTFHQQQGLPWSPDNSLVHEPVAPLLFGEQFISGGNEPVDNVLIAGNPPCAQRWEGPAPAGLRNWRKWSIDPLTVLASWIDAGRRQGIVQINAPIGAGLYKFGGMAFPFPTPPSYPFRVIVYGKVSLGRSFQTLDGVVRNMGGIFATFAALPADGEIVLVGQSQLPTGLVASSARFTNTTTLAAPPLDYNNLSPYVRLRILCSAVNNVSIQTDFCTDPQGQWWNAAQLFTGFTSLPTYIGIGGSSVGIDSFQQGMVVAANYFRGFDGTDLVAGSYSTNGSPLQIC